MNSNNIQPPLRNTPLAINTTPKPNEEEKVAPQVVFPNFNREESTATKSASFMLPAASFDEEAKARENEYFARFLQNTQEAQRIVHHSSQNFQEHKMVMDSWQVKEDFYRATVGVTGSRLDDTLKSWKSDRSDEPVLSITVAGEGLQVFQPKKLARGSWQTVDEFTWAGGSIFGLLLDEEASSPMFTELLGQNAQTNHYAAIRARGGKKGELWDRATKNSKWLREVLAESTTTKEELDEWIEANPNLLSIKGSTPFSAYWDNSVLDILEATDDEKPKDWDAKKAIEALQVADPGLYGTLFGDIGVDPERLIKLSTSPIKFKFYIADAIDSHAYQSFMNQYQEAAGAWEEAFSLYAQPLVRDSLNSNDMLSELLITAGGVALSATGVGAVVGVPLLVGKGLEKIYRIAKISHRAYNTVESVSKWGSRIAKVNTIAWKAKKFLPTQLADTALDHWGFARRTLGHVEGGSKWKNGLRWTTSQMLSEGTQGVLESGMQQFEAMENGFQETFSITDVFRNAAEEAIGGIVLGTPVRLTTNLSEKFMTTKLGDRLNTYIDTTKRAFFQDFALSPKQSTAVDTAVRLMLGIPDGMPMEDFQGAVAARLRLRLAFDRVQNTTGIKNFMEETQDPLIEAAVEALNAGGDSGDAKARVELLKRMITFMDMTQDPDNLSENTSREDLETVIYLAAQTETAGKSTAENRLNEALWLSRERQKGRITNDKGEALSIKDASEAEIKDLGEEMAERTQILAAKLGASDTKEIEVVFGKELPEEKLNLLQYILEEAEGDAAASGETGQTRVESGVNLETVVKTTLDPDQRRIDDAQDQEVEGDEEETLDDHEEPPAKDVTASRVADVATTDANVAPDTSVTTKPPISTEPEKTTPTKTETIDDLSAAATTPLTPPGALLGTGPTKVAQPAVKDSTADTRDQEHFSLLDTLKNEEKARSKIHADYDAAEDNSEEQVKSIKALEEHNTKALKLIQALIEKANRTENQGDKKELEDRAQLFYAQIKHDIGFLEQYWTENGLYEADRSGLNILLEEEKTTLELAKNHVRTSKSASEVQQAEGVKGKDPPVRGEEAQKAKYERAVWKPGNRVKFTKTVGGKTEVVRMTVLNQTNASIRGVDSNGKTRTVRLSSIKGEITRDIEAEGEVKPVKVKAEPRSIDDIMDGLIGGNPNDVDTTQDVTDEEIEELKNRNCDI